MIDKYTINKIFDAAQIVDVVSDFVTLKKRGVNYVGLCPFHDDKSPSFYVSPSKNICKCFACGEGGTAVQFIMKHEQISYYDALRYLAKKYGIEIKERELSEDEKRLNNDRESMIIVNSWAQKFFSSRLYEHEEGRNIGMPYFVEREFREDIIKKFQLGYSLIKKDDLYRNAIEQGFKEEYLIKTGLVYKREDGTIADRFHGRVIFPVHTLSGKIVAFGGRILSKKDKVAKYVNSPESEIYHKSNELYGIYFAKQAIVKNDKCYLVEGYTDVISMHQTGVENVVASSGTSLTHGQIRLIHRFTNNITVLYDGDAPGIKAAIRGIDMLLEEGMNIKVVLLPDGEDPDSFAKSRNSFDFTLFMKEHEVDFIRFKINLLLKDAGNDPIKKARLITDIMESVAVIPDNITRSVYIKECSSMLETHEQVLIDNVRRIRERRARMTREEREKEKTRRIFEAEEKANEENSSNDGNNQKEQSAETVNVATPSPFRKYETPLIKYIIRYGERPLTYDIKENENGEEVETSINVIEFIQQELQNDEICFQTPIYKKIMDDALLHCKEDDFIASRHFLANPDLEISKIASDMISNKYQLSKFFIEDKAQSLRQTTISEEGQEAEDERMKAEKEREQIERWIIKDLFTLKNAYIQRKIQEINKEIEESQSNSERLVELLKERMRLDKLNLKISRELGDRIITNV